MNSIFNFINEPRNYQLKIKAFIKWLIKNKAIKDCDDGSDEPAGICSESQCASDHFKCDNGRCIFNVSGLFGSIKPSKQVVLVKK